MPQAIWELHCCRKFVCRARHEGHLVAEHPRREVPWTSWAAWALFGGLRLHDVAAGDRRVDALAEAEIVVGVLCGEG